MFTPSSDNRKVIDAAASACPLGGLTWAEAAHESPYGRIAVSWRLADDRIDLEVTVPPGTSAEIVLPDGTIQNAGPGHHAFAG